MLAGKRVAVCAHCRADSGRAGRPEEVREFASRPGRSGGGNGCRRGARGGGAAAPLVCGFSDGRAAGVVLSRTTGLAVPIWVILQARSRALGAGVAGPGDPRRVQMLNGGASSVG